MTNHYRLPSAGWLVVFGSVACMGASMALAQRAAEPQRTTEPRPPAAAAQNPAASAPQAQEVQGRERAEARREPATAERAATPGGIVFEGQDELVVREVSPGSAAAEAGLRPRDRIVSVDGRPITGQRRLLAFLGSLTGRRVPLVIERDGRQYTIQYSAGPMNAQGAWLGVYLQDAEQEERGARITHVYPAGPAARAGLRPGDVILSVNDQAVQSAPDLIAVVDGMQPQTKVKLRVLRGEQDMEATATLASRDSYVFHQAGYGGEREPARFRDGQQEDDAFANVPPYAMQLEHDRRMAEQHERIENELRKLQEEVRLLRETLQRK